MIVTSSTIMSKMLNRRGDKKMLRVRSELCRGCGLCIESCPQQAISIVSATAHISQERCNQCRRCLEVCPQGAITEVAPVSVDGLRATVIGLKDKAEDIIVRIERLQEKQQRI
jgi:Fe-S-cluster-containing hydrogenase component 2